MQFLDSYSDISITNLIRLYVSKNVSEYTVLNERIGNIINSSIIRNQRIWIP